MWGFHDLKDVLEVIIIPLVLFALGVWLPRLWERQKRKAFIDLILRELEEMEPDPRCPISGGGWEQHLKKRFIHQTIFGNPSENRDFILSLPPTLAYNMAQLWIHFDGAIKAEAATETLAVVEHGERWCDYLKLVCKFFDKSEAGALSEKIYKPWRSLITDYKSKLGLDIAVESKGAPNKSLNPTAR